MTEALAALGAGLSVALEPANLLLCLAGVALGTLVGVLPGLGPVATIALLLPATFALPPAGALIMLAGIYYGAQYGSSTTAILLRVPGEASGVVTAQEGHLLARAGRAGPALGIAALASLLGGVLAALVLALLLQPIAGLAVAFGPAETASLMLLGVATAVALTPGPLLAAWALEALAGELALGEDVRFLGRLARPEEAYAEFDIVALSSDSEQMPLCVLEAMACGLPVAATAVGDVPHMLAEANRRFIVLREDAALAGALQELAAAPGLRAAIGAANRERAEAMYGQDAMLAAWGRVFDGA